MPPIPSSRDTARGPSRRDPGTALRPRRDGPGGPPGPPDRRRRGDRRRHRLVHGRGRPGLPGPARGAGTGPRGRPENGGGRVLVIVPYAVVTAADAQSLPAPTPRLRTRGRV